MTPGKFVTFTILALGLLTATKLFFILSLNIDNIYIVYIMWFVIAAVTTGCCRRLGVLNYLESVLTIVTWLVLSLLADLVVVSAFAGTEMYKHAYLWVTYVVIAVVIFFFHKKRHVEIRRLQAAKPEPNKGHH